MEKYIGFKLIEAEHAYKKESEIVTYDEVEATNKDTTGYEDVYKVKYPDGYISWSPQNVFETAYLQVVNNPKLKNGVSISQEMVNNFIDIIEVKTIGDKTTLVIVTLINGYEIVESSSCVDAANYDEAMGKEICLERIKNKVWELLGFLLQTAYKGIK